MITNNKFTRIVNLQPIDANQIKKYSKSQFQTHRSWLTSKIYSLGQKCLTPLRKGLYWGFVAKSNDRQGLGSGGVKKRFSWLKTAGWMSLALGFLPVTVLGLASQRFMHPGSGSDTIGLMDATKNGKISKPKIPADQPLQMATYNVAWVPNPVDAAFNVPPAERRAVEFAKWMKNQDEDDLPLFFGLQEAFDFNATKAFCQEIKETYPYAVTSAGWAKKPTFGVNSGLQFYSRVPMKSVAFYPFQDLKGRCAKSARGFLRVELEPKKGERIVVYVTHTQADDEPEIRDQEITLIKNQMEADRQENDSGRFFLIGDLNVEREPDSEGDYLSGENVEYYRLFGEDQKGEKGPLHPDFFYDPFFENRDFFSGDRTKDEPRFLKKDINKMRKGRGLPPIHEGTGTFYQGADTKDLYQGDWGTKDFFRGQQLTKENCRYDFILEYIGGKTYDDLYKDKKFKHHGEVEIRRVASKNPNASNSDHVPLFARFDKMS